MRIVVTAVLCAALLSPALTAGAADEPAAISPDRAGATDDTVTVGAGVFQIETGLAYEQERRGAGGRARRFTAEAAIRWGLTERFEIGLEGEPIVAMRGPEHATGHGELSVNAKYRFLEAPEGSWLPSLAVRSFVNLPVATDPIGSGQTDVGALLVASFSLPGLIDIDLNAGVTAVGQSNPGGFLPQAVVALGLSRDLSQSVSIFGDLLYTSKEVHDGRDSVLLDAGLIWWPTRDVALDVAMATVPVGTGPDWQVRAGVSVRFGR
jgi:hypothetical protein